MTETAHRGAESSPWSPRETELLEVTLRLLQEHGYDRLTVDAVAATARASKATVYRRWPSKAELVLAAFIESCRQVAVAPETGTLRSDLLRLGEVICQQAHQQAGTIRAVLVEVSRHPALERGTAAAVPRSTEGPDPRRPAPGGRPRRDRQRRHQRRAVGPVARVPDLPIHHAQQAPHRAHRAGARRRRHHPQPYPKAVNG